ncbi:MIF4G domain containing protein [Acanthamoeba castellanii str. Neff]|uniref:MIF4G domain containing protein n=1 Tax=Acanthamoeba castellanii (strain ATCC 30010 / Neff) TaxID=1257118 RepID=L8HJ34_ACACF|nr:MIF4G domain containing protein [Acanthamoeba castellanii str. Neff]ELR24703.1 MIF4G domain containing protein [Acanthamoeba castellanii str. Neff]
MSQHSRRWIAKPGEEEGAPPSAGPAQGNGGGRGRGRGGKLKARPDDRKAPPLAERLWARTVLEEAVVVVDAAIEAALVMYRGRRTLLPPELPVSPLLALARTRQAQRPNAAVLAAVATGKGVPTRGAAKTDVEYELDKKKREEDRSRRRKERDGRKKVEEPPKTEEQLREELERKRREEEERKKREEEEQERRRKEDEERRQREEEERKKREEEERLKREEEERKRAEEARKVREAKIALRESNIHPKPDSNLRGDSSVKRNATFVRKLAKITEDQKDKLAAEISTLNTSKFIPEAVNVIAQELTVTLKPTDISASVHVCSLMHQRYGDFARHLVPALVKSYDLPGKTEVDTVRKKRVVLRLLCELYLAGVYTDITVLISIVRDLVNTNGAEFKGDREHFVNTFQNHLMLVVSFTRVIGDEVLGIVPEKHQFVQAEPLPPLDDTATPEQKDRLTVMVKNFYKASGELLVEEHKSLRAKERENNKVLQTRGELSETDKAIYDKMRKSYDKLQNNVAAFAELLDEELPALPEEDTTTRIVVADSTQTNKLGARTQEVEPIWNDEDTRSFYEDLPQLRVLLPAVLFGDSKKDEAEEKEAAVTTDKEKEGATETTPGGDAGGAKKATAVEDSATAAKEKEEEKMSVGGVTLEELLHRLPNCVNRDLIDKAAIDFCYINTKGNRKKLIKTLFNAPRTQLALLPYYARLVATLNQCMKDIGPALVAMLEEEFNYFMRKKDQMMIETKLKNIRFLGELVKFRVCPLHLIFNCLKECLDDFLHHNIEVACALLDQCGRFLYRNPETHVRAKNMLDIMMRLKGSKNLDNRLANNVENAYYQCIPPERPARKEKTIPPMVQYTHKLVYNDLNRHTVKNILKQLRKLPWDTEEAQILDTFVKIHKGKYGNIHVVASLAAALSQYHDVMGTKLNPDFKYQQRRVAEVKYLGELYNYRLIESGTIFYALYLLLNHAAGDLTLDPPDDCFRIRLICVLLDTCGKYFDRGTSKKRLDRFLVYFQRYYLSKQYVPIDIEFMVSDAMESLRPKLQRYQTFEEAVTETEKLEKEEEAAHPPNHYPKGPIYIDKEILHEEEEEERREVDNEEEKEADDDTNTQPANSDVIKDDEDDEDGDDSDDEDDEEEEEEDDEEAQEEKAANGPNRVEDRRDPDDEEFERALQKMMRESYEQRRQDAKPVNVHTELLKPLDLLGTKKDNVVKEIGQGEKAMEFRVMLKRGKERQTKNVAIPMDCSLAVLRAQQKAEENREHEELKRRTLAAYDERAEEEKEIDEMIGSTGLAFSAAAGRGRGNQKARRQQTQSTTQRLLANAAKSTAPTSFPAGGSAAVRVATEGRKRARAETGECRVNAERGHTAD